MRISFLLAFASLAALPLVPVACSSASQAAAPADGGAEGSTGGDGGGSVIPQTEACTGAASACLHGTAKTTGFMATPKRMQVSLYGTFPSGSAAPLETVPVAVDGTWAISDVSSLAPQAGLLHYYVEVAADFGVTGTDGSVQPAPARILGPFTLPSSGALPELQVLPVQLTLLESVASGAYQVDWVEALVFDPASGAPVTGAGTVSISIGGTATTVPWGTAPGGQPAYFLKLGTPPAAQASYAVTTTATAGGASSMWTLDAVTPSFTPTVTAPAAGATVMSTQDLAVSWPAQPLADYVIVELFDQNTQHQWTGVYNSAQPDPPDTTSETVPKADLATPGPYLVDVSFANASCPATASGCVLASTAATTQITVQ